MMHADQQSGGAGMCNAAPCMCINACHQQQAIVQEDAAHSSRMRAAGGSAPQLTRLASLPARDDAARLGLAPQQW